MGGSVAEFRGFWVARGCGAAIQRTADSGGLTGRKIFKKGVENRKIGGTRGSGRWPGSALYRDESVLIDGRTLLHMSSLAYSLPDTAKSDFPACTHSLDANHSNSSLKSESLPYPSDDHSYQSRQETPVSQKNISAPQGFPATTTHLTSKEPDALTNSSRLLIVFFYLWHWGKVCILPILYSIAICILTVFISDNNLGFLNNLNTPEFVVYILLFLMINFSPAKSIADTLYKIRKTAIKPRIKYKENQSSKNGIRDLLSLQVKYALSTIPLSASVIFIIVLIHNKDLAKGDLGTAIQITAIQFTDNKYSWTAIAITFIALVYIAIIPTFLLLPINKAILSSSRQAPSKDSYKRSLSILFRLNSITIGLLLPVSYAEYQILKVVSGKEEFIILFLLITMSYTICIHSIKNTFVESCNFKRKQNISSNKDTPAWREKTQDSIIILLMSTVAIFCLNNFMNGIIKNISDIAASPGETLNSARSDYSCIFSNDNNSKTSIAFGVVAASKPDSIHIFTPEYNHGNMTYGKQHDSGWIELNPLVETQVKIPAGYHIEKFNGIKHHYNISTGKCEYTKTRYSIIINNQENQNRPPRKY